MNHEHLESRARSLSELGLKVRLTELPQDAGWGWEWALGGVIIERRDTKGGKEAALYLALLTGLA